MKSRGFTALFLTTLLSGTVCLVPNSAWARDGGSSDYSPGNEYSGSSIYSSDSNPNSTTSDIYQDALDSAISATAIAQSAVSKDDWELVSSKLQDSINLLKEVPASSPNYAEAQVKIQEYGASLNYAQQQLGLLPLIQPEEVATQTTFNGEFQPNEESSISVASDISPTVPSQDLIAIDSVSPSPEVMPTAPTASPEVTLDSESNPLGAMILTVLVALVAVGFYKAKTIKHSDAKSAPVTKNVPVNPTVPTYSSPNYQIPKNYSVPDFEIGGFLERAGSIALGLGILVAFGLINQKMGGGVGGGSVRVSGYRRSNGTFVDSYTRHRPR